MFSEHLLHAGHGARHQADSSSTVVSSCVPHPCHPPTLFTPSDDSEPTFTLKPASLDSLVKRDVDTVGNEQIFVEGLKWKGAQALSTGHTE